MRTPLMHSRFGLRVARTFSLWDAPRACVAVAQHPRGVHTAGLQEVSS